MADTFERELSWDDEIVKESDFVLLPEGDYDFTVTGFERGRHEGSDKLPPCNKAIISIHIASNEGEATLKHNLFLHTKTEGMLSAFFCAIGQKKHGEPLHMNWNAVIGARGRCKIGQKPGFKNPDVMYNEVKKFYDPEEAPNAVKRQNASSTSQYQPAFAPTGVYTPGKF